MGRRLNPFVPSPRDVLNRAFEEAGIVPGSLMVDLGSGDGRAPMIAAKEFGAKAVGFEINDALVHYAEQSRRRLRLNDVRYVKADIRHVDLRSVDVVFAYLTSDALEAIKPVLMTADEETLVMTHDYPIPGWEPSEVLRLRSDTTARTHLFYLYRIRDVVRRIGRSGSGMGPTVPTTPSISIRTLFDEDA
ncbi:MAG: class I SAM-dependent methyltransferase [Nitrososphaerota archaeon]|nr:class I SAM-dependent methyltransferase [Nitrososphaerota archaeon]